MHYPVFVYRCPGAHFGPIGTTYESTVANDEKEFSNLLANGWSESLIKAVDTFLSPAKLVEDLEELELKAREIGVKFDGRTTDALLLKRIENAIGGK